MLAAYLDAIANAGGALITYIGLFNGATEIAGGSPAYARKAVTWTASSSGLIRPTANLDFDVPASTVDNWKGFSALTGGTGFGGETLATEVFAGQGIYRLLAASTGIQHTAV